MKDSTRDGLEEAALLQTSDGKRGTLEVVDIAMTRCMAMMILVSRASGTCSSNPSQRAGIQVLSLAYLANTGPLKALPKWFLTPQKRIL